jgi:hypothetical protein
MYRIARLNHRHGVPYMTFGEVRQVWQNIRKYRNLQKGVEKESGEQKAQEADAVLSGRQDIVSL